LKNWIGPKTGWEDAGCQIPDAGGPVVQASSLLVCQNSRPSVRTDPDAAQPHQPIKAEDLPRHGSAPLRRCRTVRRQDAALYGNRDVCRYAVAAGVSPAAEPGFQLGGIRSASAPTRFQPAGKQL